MALLSRLLGDTIKSRLRLLSLLLIFLPPTLGLGIFAIYARYYTLEKASENLTHILTYEKNFIESWMQERTRDVAFLAALPVVQRLDYPAMEALFHNYNDTHDDVTAVVYVDIDGVNIVDSSTSKRINVTDRAYFKDAQRGEPHVTDIIIGRTSGKPIIIISEPVMIDGVFSGLVFTPVRLATIDILQEELKVGRNGRVVMLDAQGVRYSGIDTGETAHTNATFIDKAVLGKMAASPGNGVTFITPDGVQAIGATLPVNNGKWLLIGYIPLAEVLEDYAAFLLTALGGGVITLLLITPLLIRLSRSLERPLFHLAEMAKTMAEGRFNNACPLLSEARSQLWEVRTLADAFCRMQEMLAKSMDALRKAAVTDPLTGLWNRRQLLDEGVRAVEICQRGDQPCACLMLDVDHFKRVNDTWGHHAGDEVLKHVSRILQETLRASDIAARFGGEEFAIVAPNADRTQTETLAERLREAFACCPLQMEEASVSLTVSIGVAICRMDTGVDNEKVPAFHGDEILHDALTRADKALYQAKEGGRNRVVVAAS